MPAISQCPVVVSLPGDASAHLPKAAVGCAAGSMCASGLIFPKPNTARFGKCSVRLRAMLPSVSLPTSPYAAASGIAPMPTLSSTIQVIRPNAPLFISSQWPSLSYWSRRRRPCRRTECLIDAIGQHVHKAFGHITDHPRDDFAFLSEDDGGRDAGDLQQSGQAIFKVDLLGPLLRLDERLHDGMILVGIDGEKN